MDKEEEEFKELFSKVLICWGKILTDNDGGQTVGFYNSDSLNSLKV